MDLTNFTSMTISLQSGALADSYTIEHLTNAPIGTAYAGTLYGWPWGCTVRGREYVPGSGRYKLTGDYDISEKLKKYLTFATTVNDSPTAMTSVATQLGKTAAINIDSHGVRRLSEQTTLMQVLTTLFSWTSAIPHQFVNVFQRGNTLYCIQRGKESGSYALQNYDIKDLSEKLMDMLMDESLWDPQIIGDPDGTYVDGAYGGCVYKDGYLISETNGDTQVTYSYSQTEPKYLLGITEVGPGHLPYETTFSYGTYRNKPWLASITKIEDMGRENYQPWNAGPWMPLSKSVTTHSPAGSGFYSVRTETQENTFHAIFFLDTWMSPAINTPGWVAGTKKVTYGWGEGRPGGPATPRERSGEENTPTLTIAHNPIASNHIPVTETTTLQRYADGLNYLDGKCEHRIKVDCYDEHVVDFDLTVTVAGNVWYLEQNQISISAAGIVQSLELVRWA